eukprot:CAMPEP_0197825630 /NCGR_PEP_ID=MMETSP1437-20131217/2681_1 /TAXON_ID=49252 ORGANISM="Eucampia antarctica, Strain CCMP1452" /NCGR_SAMPLE_ID=MMETSP1437 /ASSEMBLY_ACC=CAM_ASM_001096 /LENGTH=240 /DNA_ID=CAMNT_0043425711 /DNA_START=36 /DNA_END=758 /DNA_ORIENTATION=+
MTYSKSLLFLLIAACSAPSGNNAGVDAFSFQRSSMLSQISSSQNLKKARFSDELMTMEQNEEPCSRRDMFVKSAVATVSSTIISTFINPSIALAGAPPSKEELERIKVGHEQIVYLLDNFDKETTKCRENGGECKRDANSVRQYLGLRSTTDPLFQIEKVFVKAKYMDIDPDNIETFFEATEEWNTAVNMSNSMAFISQFAEYNPGGGKDEVLKYLEESKIQVILAEKALTKIMKCLEIS